MPNQYVNKVVKSDGTTLLDLSQDTVTLASHIMAGYVGHLANGEQVTGTGQGGPSATAHTIYFEFSDGTDITLTGYWDGSFISDAITATTPSTYGGKTVTLAQLDGVTWYEPATIPLNTQLIDFTAVSNDTLVDPVNGQEMEFPWISTSDYTMIDSSMTFSYKGLGRGYIVFFNDSKTYLSYLSISADTGGGDYDICSGTLTPAKIPSTAKYVRINSDNNPGDNELSLIRTA